MKRRSSDTGLNPNLLLDTLCNALGGVIFIALLVVLIAYQAPVKDSRGELEKTQTARTQALVEELKHLPGRDSLAQNLQAYTRAVDDYARTSLTPVTPTATQDILLAERARLKRLAGTSTPQKPSYSVPALRKSADFEAGYVVVFKNDSVYSAPLSAELLRQSNPGLPLRVQNLRYILRGNAVQVETADDAGQTVSAALGKLVSEIQNGNASKRIVPDKTKLFLYVYPDGVSAFHLYRKQAMASMPNVIWFGIPENEQPLILLTETKQGGEEDLSF